MPRDQLFQPVFRDSHTTPPSAPCLLGRPGWWDYNSHNAPRSYVTLLAEPLEASNKMWFCWFVLGAASRKPSVSLLLWSWVAFPSACWSSAMGGTESSENRRVTFGMDEKKRVRVLQGIRVSWPPAGATCKRTWDTAGVEGAVGAEGAEAGAALGRGACRERVGATSSWNTAYSMVESISPSAQ